MRVSENTTILANKFLYDLRTDQFATKTVSGATITKRTNQPVIELTTTGTIGSRAVLQSKSAPAYIPGKSQLIKLTGAFGDAVTGQTKRIGCFNDNDGIFFEQSGGTYYIVVRSHASGSVVERKFARASWDDKLDGTGPSAGEVDLSIPLIFVYDYQYLGLGTIRLMLEIDGLPIPILKINNVGTLTYANPVYMANPNLPARYEIVNTAASTGSQMIAVCQAVESEGGVTQDYEPYSANNGMTPATIQQVNSGIPAIVLMIRLVSGYTGVNLRTFGIDITTFGNAEFVWAFVKNPTLNFTPTWTAIGGGSAIEYWKPAATISATNVTNVGRILSSGAAPSVVRESSESYSFDEQIGTDVDGVSDIYAIYACPGANSKIFAGIHWGELT